LSRAQVTRLIGQYMNPGTIEEKGTTGAASRACTPELTLVYRQKLDEAHETMSGPATQKILYREYHEYGNLEYQRLCQISVPHIYNLLFASFGGRKSA
jgi:hypothetical protein